MRTDEPSRLARRCPARAWRIAASLLGATAVAGVVGIAAVAGSAATAATKPAPGTPCGALTDSTYLSTSLAVALRIAQGERQGAAVSRAVKTIEADRVLANA